LNDFRDIDIHEMVERLDLVRYDLPAFCLFEVEIENVSIGREHYCF
jgi:hypothetical protein